MPSIPALNPSCLTRSLAGRHAAIRAHCGRAPLHPYSAPPPARAVPDPAGGGAFRQQHL